MSEKPIRVLMIDDDENDYVLIRELLGQVEGRRYDVRWARNFAHAVPAIRGGRHDIFIVDYRLEGRSGLDLLRSYLDGGRKGPVIILTGYGTHETDIEAMESGASAFMLKGNFDAEELDRVIRYAISRYHSSQALATATGNACRVVSFIGAKGGVGTTSVAVNVAAAAAEQGQQVTLIELRPSAGTLDQQVQLPSHWDLGVLLRLPAKDINVETLDRVLTRDSNGMRVLAAPANASDCRPIEAEQVSAIVAAASELSGLIVLDLPHEPSPANRRALELSQTAVLVLEREPNSLVAAVVARRLFDAWKIKTPVGAVVVERAKLSAPIPVAKIGSELSQLNCDIYAIVPTAEHPPGVARLKSAPMVLSAPEHEASRALVALSARLAKADRRPASADAGA